MLPILLRDMSERKRLLLGEWRFFKGFVFLMVRFEHISKLRLT